MENPVLNAEKFLKGITSLNLSLILNKESDFNLDPNECGAAAPMFKEISLQVGLFWFDYRRDGGKYGHKLNLKYRYQHPCGSNGYDISYISYDSCKTLVIF